MRGSNSVDINPFIKINKLFIPIIKEIEEQKEEEEKKPCNNKTINSPLST